ncbi:MAG: purine-nucleoside phosphorylase [Streptococcaceae bacterium]|jgi:purine-nucleoside phosphorylase|nr:purine-nucleoside phosphorylase [Streptococcaceae bacterium]
MSIHIEAKVGEIADKILLPGDPLRAKYIAENFLENAVLFNNVRGMLGYTGTYKGERVSVMGTGMGMPSMAIYVTELIKDYGVKKLIRIGSCGSLSADVHVRDLVLAQSTSTTSRIMMNDWPHVSIAPTSDWDLLYKAYNIASERNFPTHVGPVLTSDLFYSDFFEDNLKLGHQGHLAVEMEAAVLYYLAKQYQVQALAIMTVSDSLVTSEETTSEEREKTFSDMMVVGLETLVGKA